VVKINNLKINADTFLIDIGIHGFEGIGAAYLIKAGRTCLIDGGTSEGSAQMIEVLRSVDAFPPDLIVLTHSHWDHTQAVPAMQRMAKKREKK
jgi:glyoxylase-like metal-dependent hydrolase (beta-lactamase superfamily II)